MTEDQALHTLQTNYVQRRTKLRPFASVKVLKRKLLTFCRLKFKFDLLKCVGIIPLARDQTYSSASWISSVRIQLQFPIFRSFVIRRRQSDHPHPTPLRFVNMFERCFLAKKINRRKLY